MEAAAGRIPNRLTPWVGLVSLQIARRRMIPSLDSSRAVGSY